MPDNRSLTILCISSYEKGQEFIRTCKGMGCRVLLLTVEKLRHADWPFEAIDEMVRVLAPGGRIALLTSCRRGPAPLRAVSLAATAPGGIRVFGRDEITAALERAGMSEVRQRVSGFAQFVGARNPGAN